MNVRIGHRGDRCVELGAWHAVAGQPMRFCDAEGALLFLREKMLASDVSTLRVLLTGLNVLTGRPDDATLLRQVAQRLHARALKAVVLHDRRHGVVERRDGWRPARVEVPAAAPRESPSLDDAPIVRPAPAPLEPAWDGEAQAMTLRAAARDGAPLCEICTPAPSPPAKAAPVDSDLPVDSDPVAQAQVLRAAAVDGSPFCALCRQ